MTVTEITTTMVSEKTQDWRNNGTPNLPTFATNNNKISSRLEAKSKMRLSIQMARMREKLPDDEKQGPPLTTSNNKDNDNSEILNSSKKYEQVTEIPAPSSPPTPCNACRPLDSREYVRNLLK